MFQEIKNLVVEPRTITLGQAVAIECDLTLDGLPFLLRPLYIVNALTGLSYLLGKTDGNGHLKASWVPSSREVGTYGYYLLADRVEVDPGLWVDYGYSVPFSLSVMGMEIVADLAWAGGKLS